MRRIRPFEVCVEAVITRHGTLVGPYVGLDWSATPS